MGRQRDDEQLTFTFVGDGLEAAFDRAKIAAADRNVIIVGGASTIQQGLNVGLVDELQVTVGPVFFGAGLCFFAHLDAEDIILEPVATIQMPGFTDLRYRVGGKAR